MDLGGVVIQVGKECVDLFDEDDIRDPDRVVRLVEADVRRAVEAREVLVRYPPEEPHRRTQALGPALKSHYGLTLSETGVVLAATGILLMFYYVPSVEQAHNRMLDLSGTVAFGVLLRNMHRWAAHGMVAIVFLHMCRVFYHGAYKAPREFNWVIGVILLTLTLLLSFTGYLLPWDQLALWAVTVGTNMMGYTPVFGSSVKFVLLGSREIGNDTLLRWYVLHVLLLPFVTVIFMAVHFWRVRKDGGISGPL